MITMFGLAIFETPLLLGMGIAFTATPQEIVVLAPVQGEIEHEYEIVELK